MSIINIYINVDVLNSFYLQMISIKSHHQVKKKKNHLMINDYILLLLKKLIVINTFPSLMYT